MIDLLRVEVLAHLEGGEHVDGGVFDTVERVGVLDLRKAGGNKRIVADQMLDIEGLKELAKGNF